MPLTPQTRRKIFLGVGATALGVALSGVVVFLLASRSPGWYVPVRDPDQIDREARQFEDRIVTARNDAGAAVAREARARSQKSGGPAAAADAITVTLPAGELTSFVRKWSTLQGWNQTYGHLIQEPAVRIDGGEVQVAGKSAMLGAVVVLRLRPTFTPAGAKDGGSDGEPTMRLTFVGASIGVLPVPSGLVTPQLRNVEGALQEAMGRWSQDARLDSRGLANSALTLLLAGRLATSALTDKPVPAVVALPADERRSLPVTIESLSLQDGVMKVGLRPIAPDRRAALLGVGK